MLGSRLEKFFEDKFFTELQLEQNNVQCGKLSFYSTLFTGADSGGGAPGARPPLKKKKKKKRERGGEERGSKEETIRSIRGKTSAEAFVI